MGALQDWCEVVRTHMGTSGMPSLSLEMDLRVLHETAKRRCTQMLLDFRWLHVMHP